MTSEPPRRLHTDPESELERALLGAGRSYRASSRARNQVLAGLGLAGVAASSNAAASVLGKVGAAKWVIAAAVAAGVAVPAVHYLNKRHAAPEPPTKISAAPTAPTQALAAALRAEASGEPEAASGEPEAASGEPEVAIAPSATPALSVAPHIEPKSASLSAELSALDAARSSLVAGDPNAALSALDAYSRKFPRGKLSLEAEVLRIDALAKSGQTAAAQKRASAFIQRHPDSVLATRVRAFAAQ